MSLNFDETATYGAFHGAEVPFVFGYQAELSTDTERAVSLAMGCYWRSFMHHGNPNSGSCGAFWPQFDQDTFMVQKFGANISAVSTKLDQDRCDFIEVHNEHEQLMI